MTVPPAPLRLQQLLSAMEAELPADQLAIVARAHDFVQTVLGESRHPAGHLYQEHGLAVGREVYSLGLDGYCVAAGILMTTLDSHASGRLDEIRRHFDGPVMGLVNGLSEIEAFTRRQESRVYDSVVDEASLEQIRRTLLIIIQKEVYVILIRMAALVVELRFAAGVADELRWAPANEAMLIYAPLANRLGVWRLKWELEDLAFRYLQPEQYREIAGRLNERRADRNRKVERTARRLEQELRANGIPAQVTGRSKHIYSIYRKMQAKQVGFDDIYDKDALRIIIETGLLDKSKLTRKNRKQIEQLARGYCYQALGIVHGLWQVIPQEFDDYIAHPKPNGYQSLHTAVIDDQGQTLEVQIRTDIMHIEAERGIAAHWAYKENGVRPSASVSRYILNLRQLLGTDGGEGEDDEPDQNELTSTELLAERIFVFTPKGDMIDLPAGATPIDFAYAIHTQVGHRCRGAKVNGIMVSLDHQLQAGDRVEIVTTKRGGPSRDWMNPNLGYTASTRTRSKIRNWFRKQEREQNIAQGQELVQRELRRLGLTETFTVADIAGALGFINEEKFLAEVGFGDIQSPQISGAITRLRQKLEPDDELLELMKPRSRPTRGLIVRGVPGLHTNMAGCCTPIPPEPIIGFITRGKGVTIHRRDCKTLANIEERERLIDVEWGLEQDTYPIPLVIESYQHHGLPEGITKILRGRNVAVAKTKTQTRQNLTTIYLVVEVADLEQLDWVIKKLEELPMVLEVRRQRWQD